MTWRHPYSKPNRTRHHSSNSSKVFSEFTDYVDRRYETAKPQYLSLMDHSSIFILTNGKVKLVSGENGDAVGEHGDAVFDFFKDKGKFPPELSKMPSFGEAASWAVEQGFVRGHGYGNEYSFQVPVLVTESQLESIEKISGHFDEMKWEIQKFPYTPENDGSGFRSLLKRTHSVRNKGAFR